MAKIQIKSEKLTPFRGLFSGHGAILLHIVISNRLNGRTETYDAEKNPFGCWCKFPVEELTARGKTDVPPDL